MSLQDPTKLEHVRELYAKVVKANGEYQSFWVENTFLHWDFWTSCFFTVTPWVLWYVLRKKDSTFRLLSAGLVVLTLSSWFDFLGVIWGAWYYTGKVVPTLPSYIPWDFCLMPVTVMLIIQYKPQASPIVKGIAFATLAAFVGEPLFEWLGFYVPLKWNSFMSWPLYVLFFLIADWFSKRTSYQRIAE